MPRQAINITDYIEPLHINGLSGRVLNLPAQKSTTKKEILMLYGHHASIERMMGLAEDLRKYAKVTLPDLPGLGGMDSFYTIGKKPTLDNMADYLASFVKMRYKNRRFTIIAMSFGFVVATRMLQKYPELAKRVDVVVSIVGFAHKDDFRFKRRNWILMNIMTRAFSHRVPAWLVQHVVLRPAFIRMAYHLVENTHDKLKDADEAERKRRVDFEIGLWQMNDIRTYMDNAVTMFKLDLCTQQVDLPVWHVTVEPDRYFDNRLVEQHLHIIYNDVTIALSKMAGHAPSVVATAKEAAPFIPASARRMLRQT
ncbi:MAG: hypothetical protein JWM37_353 [Candidatus Saccharibacteria bacterium]|nr:hypothetical protein [Candidatus Saccharibacteria bacterium]